MIVRSAEETKKDNIAKLGDALGEQYSALWQELSIAYLYWKEYEVLFGTKPARIELLNKAAPQFFHMLQEELWNTSLLNIARMTDPPSTAGKDNLTIQALPALIKDDAPKKIVADLVAVAMKHSEFARDWRNRRIAHRDLKLALNAQAQPLKDASRKQVKETLAALADVLNAIDKDYLDGTTGYDFVSSQHGAFSLLYLMSDGLDAQEQKRKRIESGEYTIEDVLPKDL